MTKSSGSAMTNKRTGSIAQIQHSEPTITLAGRIAGGAAGRVGLAGPGRKEDLHFTLLIDDAYSGIFGFDGQPTTFDLEQFESGSPIDSIKRLTRVKVNFYYNEMPKNVKIQFPIVPPPGMSRQQFAQELVRRAHNFASFTLPYSFPKNVVGEVMVEGEYNSSSFLAGLLQSVMGVVPKLETPGYQTPGWEMPIPTSYFKGEALR